MGHNIQKKFIRLCAVIFLGAMVSFLVLAILYLGYHRIFALNPGKGVVPTGESFRINITEYGLSRQLYLDTGSYPLKDNKTTLESTLLDFGYGYVKLYFRNNITNPPKEPSSKVFSTTDPKFRVNYSQRFILLPGQTVALDDENITVTLFICAIDNHIGD
ncbi:MAG: hypothetical protein PHG85_02370 [Candidatus Altiarchaeota archaeon]|nr:hypothetical protein [Candidatus Altiarchaeota archaeon]